MEGQSSLWQLTGIIPETMFNLFNKGVGTVRVQFLLCTL